MRNDATRRGALALTGAGLAAALADAPARANPARGSAGLPFEMARGGAVAALTLDPGAPAWLLKAVDDLRDDVARVAGRRPETTARAGEPRLLVAVAGSPWLAREAPGLARAAEALAGRSEAWLLRSDGRGTAAIVGADADGARRGVYAFCQHRLGVDPTRRFTGLSPARRTEIAWPHLDETADSPAVPLRGWFLNDEDLLTEWKESAGRRRIDYPFYGQVIAPEALDAVLETLVRLRFNAVVPASFVDIRNPVEKALLDQAAARGLWLHQHHIEPVGVSAFGYFNYWRDQGREPPVFSYHSSRKELERVWLDYIVRWAEYDRVIWSLGHRGIADRPLWMADPAVPQDDASVGRIISDAMAFQHRTVLEHAGDKEAVFATNLWAEGAALMAGGHLRVPDGTIVMFADNGPGFRLQQDFYEVPRRPEGRYGVYYHHQIWSSGPHLVQATPPWRTSAVMADALGSGANDFVLVNVGNVREFVVGLSVTAPLLEDGPQENLDAELYDLCGRWYGSANALAGARLHRAFFDAYALDPVARRPLMLDGLIRGRGLGLLTEMTSPPSDEEARPTAHQQVERSWGRRHLADMGDLELTAGERAAQRRRQTAAFEGVREAARAFVAALPAEPAALADANLVVQADIMLGLLAWLEAVEQAAVERRADRRAAVRSLAEAEAGLDAAITAFRGAETGAFRNWYRGDKKMNLRDMRRRTSDARRALLSD